jgi:uncharacterized membrane protein
MTRSATDGIAAMAATFGVIGAGAALIEAALVPGILIGGAAVLAPRLFPALRRGLRSRPVQALPKRAVKQAVVKTITFRVIVTSLDFTTNYIVLGNAVTAAGLSTFSLAVGPLFYLGHEMAWNHVTTRTGRLQTPATSIDLPWPMTPDGVRIGVPLAKTVTFRAFASTMDFATNFVVVGDLATAAVLSATGFVLGPFVYYGHEKAWERWGARWAAPMP